MVFIPELEVISLRLATTFSDQRIPAKWNIFLATCDALVAKSSYLAVKMRSEKSEEEIINRLKHY